MTKIDDPSVNTEELIRGSSPEKKPESPRKTSVAAKKEESEEKIEDEEQSKEVVKTENVSGEIEVARPGESSLSEGEGDSQESPSPVVTKMSTRRRTKLKEEQDEKVR